METHKDLPILTFTTQAQFREWLEQYHANTPAGVWLRFYKKASGQKTFTYTQALDEALCYGWIDSVVNKGDDNYYLQKFTPRRPRSIWSQVNQEKVARLIKDNQMQPAGQKAIEAAKTNGQWEKAYASSSKIEVPKDLQAWLNETPAAKSFFESLTKTDRYSYLWWLHEAKKPETRERRLEQAKEKLMNGQKRYDN